MELDELKLLVLSVPTEACSSALDDSEQKELEELCDSCGVDLDEGHGLKWWNPFLCRAKKGSVKLGKYRVAPRCNSRACLECHQKKLYGMMQMAGELVTTKKLFGIVLTPRVGRIKTQDDVEEFLSSVRLLLRNWERYYGLEYAFWVAECVVKPDEERTRIPCPIHTRHLPDDLEDQYEAEKVEALKGLQACCHAGIGCPICDGTGYLPSVHLHVHLAISCDPFWWGRGQKNEKDNYQDFGQRGFHGFLDDHGLGHGAIQDIYSPAGLAQYLSKECIVYFSKGYQDKNGPELAHDDSDPSVEERHWNKRDKMDMGDVDWNASQKGALISSAVYGRKRHRGTNGTAYGCKLRVKDASIMPSYSSDMVKDDLSGGMCGALLSGSCKEYLEEQRMAKIARAMEKERGQKSLFIKALTVGKKRQKELGFQNASVASDTINVLMKTQLDGGVNSVGGARASLGFLRENRGSIFKYSLLEDWGEGKRYGIFTEFERRLDAEASHFVKRWDGVVCVKENEYWACLVKDYFVFGKGGSYFSLPLEILARANAYGVEWIDDRVFENLLLSLVREDWKEWVLRQEMILTNGLFKKKRVRVVLNY